jgi:hypothetical protein
MDGGAESGKRVLVCRRPVRPRYSINPFLQISRPQFAAALERLGSPVPVAMNWQYRPFRTRGSGWVCLSIPDPPYAVIRKNAVRASV